MNTQNIKWSKIIDSRTKTYTNGRFISPIPPKFKMFEVFELRIKTIIMKKVLYMGRKIFER